MIDTQALNGIDTTQYASQVRSNARLVDAGRKMIASCKLAQQLEVCITLVADYDWTIDEQVEGKKQLPLEYRDAIKKEIGLY